MRLLHKQILLLSVLISVILLHLPFIESDPDIDISTSAGPYTDEGLYTANVRNFIIYGDYDFKLSDVPVKSPVFPWLFYVPFKIFGISLTVARLTVLLLVFLIYFITFGRNNKMILPATFFLPFVFLQYYIFHFSHYALSEIITIMLMLSAIAVADKFLSAGKSVSAGIFSSLIVFLTLLLKLNFIYLIVVFPASFLFLMLSSKNEKPVYKKAFLYSTGTTVILLGAFIIFWIVPNKEMIFNILSEQSKNKFVNLSQIPGNAFIIVRYILFSKKLVVFSLTFLLSVAVFILNFKKFIHSRFKFYFVFLFLWLIAESHKFSMGYLPSRYFLSMIFPMMTFSVLVMFIYFSKIQNSQKYLVLIIAAVMITVNSVFYVKSYRNRDYKIQLISNFIGEKYPDKAVGFGNWSSSLSWKTKIRTLPVIENSYNDSDVINKFHPDFIAIRDYMPDIERFNRHNNIDLYKDSKSVNHYIIGRFRVVVFRLQNVK